MQADATGKRRLKQKVTFELEELASLTAYLAFFFGVVTTYSLLLRGTVQGSWFAYGVALLNAVVTAKVILIGEVVHLGRRYERKAVFPSAIWKAFVFAWLVFAFHVVEDIIKGMVHGETFARAAQSLHIYDLLVRTALVFCTFVPLFIVRELRRVIGDERFRDLFFHIAPSARNA
jgi:hypothetical protein